MDLPVNVFAVFLCTESLYTCVNEFWWNNESLVGAIKNMQNLSEGFWKKRKSPYQAFIPPL